MEAGGDEGGGLVGGREEGCGGVDGEEGVVFRFELEGTQGRYRQGGRHKHDEWVFGAVFLERVGEGDDAGEVGGTGEESNPGILRRRGVLSH